MRMRSLIVGILCLLFLPSLSATTYYLNGTPSDQATKLQQTPGSATFGTVAPTGAAPIMQSGSWLASVDVPGDSLSMYWSGAFSGTVSGVLDLQWYWSTQNPEAAALGGTVDVSIFADPDYNSTDPQPGRLIGTALAEFPISGVPTLVQTIVPVSGTVQGTLLIQVVPHFSDTGNAMNVYYGSTTAPSSFSFHAAPVRVPFPAAKPASGSSPRFTLFTPSPSQLSSGLGTDAGEPSIGVNWSSGNAFFQSFLTTFKVSFDDSCPTTPMSSWVNKESPITGTESFDPILYTDHATGRTFVSQLILGAAQSAAAFTDNDGELWLPSQGSGIVSGIDHQTFGGGPFHQPLLGGAFYPTAVYYCAQSLVTANCAISLDGGVTFGPAVPVYTTECGGLHGHIKVGADGTAYLPNKDCGGQQGVVVSEDNGATWSIRRVPNSLAGNSDPSVAIAKDNRVYLAFADADHHPVVSVSDDHGLTWHDSSDVGAAAGLQNIAFPLMVAGDRDRATMAFLGTSTVGGLQDRAFPGVWNMYVAATYDGGKTWALSNATPNDPVQRGPIWMKGGGEISRNLLDFNDATVDKQGRVLIGFADGCVTNCVGAPASSRGNSYSAIASILRQNGGRRMFSEYDPAEPTIPSAPAITVSRVGSIARLTWSESNDGGSPITNYTVLRSSAGQSEKTLATVTSASYTDPTADANTTYSYRVVATNGVGASCGTNAVTSAPGGTPCNGAGVVVLTDATGDQIGAPLNPALDIQSVSIAEPYYADGSKKIAITMKMASLASLPPASEWRLIWNFPTTVSGNYYVEMHTDENGAVAFEYGTIDLIDALVTSVGTPHPLGPADAESAYNADGTIRIVLNTDLIGSPVPGDLMGGLTARTHVEAGSVVTTSRTATDVANTYKAYVFVGNAFCAPPVTTCYEDDDAHIAYSNGWHLQSNGAASAGHFRYAASKATASINFTVPANQFGAATFFYAKSPQGGTGDVYLDGVLQGTINFNGALGTTKAPQFGFNQRYWPIGGGNHTLLIKATKGVIYLDKFCLESSASNTLSTTGPGTTNNANLTMTPGQQQTSQLLMPPNAQAVSIMAESNLSAPIRILLIDPLGATVATVDSTNGLAVINQAVTPGGLYVLKVVNLSAGPVTAWTAATPWVNR